MIPLHSFQPKRSCRSRGGDGASAAHAGFQWDYVFDWTIMKYQHQQPRIPPALEPAQREVRRTPQDEERERHGSSFNRAGAPAEASRRR